MSWTVLKPLSNSNARPLVSAQVKVLKNGTVKVIIYLSGTLYDEVGSPGTAQIMEGDGEFHGCVRMQFGEGPFAFTGFVHGGGRVQIPLVQGAPNRETRTQQCQIIEQSQDGLTLRLPLAAWDEEAAPRSGQRALPAPTPAPSAPVRADDNRVDAIAYLKGKGHRIDQLNGGRMQIDGEVYTPDRVLARLNAHRRVADLPALVLADLRFG